MKDCTLLLGELCNLELQVTNVVYLMMVAFLYSATEKYESKTAVSSFIATIALCICTFTVTHRHILVRVAL